MKWTGPMIATWVLIMTTGYYGQTIVIPGYRSLDECEAAKVAVAANLPSYMSHGGHAFCVPGPARRE